MFMEERQQKISELIKENGKISVTEITQKFGISDESARRDLRFLEQKGLCKRTYGGAILLRQVKITSPENRQYNDMVIFPNYKAIAEIAVNRIKENDIVYITSGSFGHIIISLLPENIRFTAVVNSVDMAQELRFYENVDVYVAGGKMRKSGSVVDTIATEFISRLHFDICFITGGGLTAEFGLSNGSDETAAFQRAVLKNSRQKYLLLPSSKISVNSFIKVCNAEAFDALITDRDCAEEELSALEEKGIKIIVAEE
ncbi:MAG: DeoR/GlpR transcriptional regulator [Ruminococcaceae bacterium]|nr:DeoR/GlpR transcriptional regulator [Oscillospiraceae bacterium]